jgi:hypothetical protein
VDVVVAVAVDVNATLDVVVHVNGNATLAVIAPVIDYRSECPRRINAA